jgi:hypothetical protein
MATLRLIEPHEHPAPDKPPQTVQPREEVPIRLESLPIPLRAVVRDQPDGSLRIEAELPWLAVGTAVHAGSPEGGERTAQVQDFDMEVTSGGSARLVILTAPPAGALAPAVARTQPQARRHFRSLVGGALIAIAAAASGYAVGRLSPAKLALEAPRPAPLASALPVPPAAPPVAQAQLPAPPPPAPTLAEATEPTPAAVPPHKTVRKAGKAKSASSHKHRVSRRP